MKCYELQGPHGIDGLTLVDKPVPEPGAGEVLVRLKAATLNYRDLITVKGGYAAIFHLTPERELLARSSDHGVRA